MAIVVYQCRYGCVERWLGVGGGLGSKRKRERDPVQLEAGCLWVQVLQIWLLLQW